LIPRSASNGRVLCLLVQTKTMISKSRFSRQVSSGISWMNEGDYDTWLLGTRPPSSYPACRPQQLEPKRFLLFCVAIAESKRRVFRRSRMYVVEWKGAKTMSCTTANKHERRGPLLSRRRVLVVFVFVVDDVVVIAVVTHRNSL
jgi:hypothetical protein